MPNATARRRLAAVAFAPVLLGGLGGCVFGRGRPSEPTVTVRIQNTLLPASTVTISLIPAEGARRAVGVVTASQTSDLRIPVGNSADPHRLLAEAASGAAYASRTFTLSSAGTVEWNVGTNALNVIPR